jgi:hypothetical protein
MTRLPSDCSDFELFSRHPEFSFLDQYRFLSQELLLSSRLRPHFKSFLRLFRFVPESQLDLMHYGALDPIPRDDWKPFYELAKVAAAAA